MRYLVCKDNSTSTQTPEDDNSDDCCNDIIYSDHNDKTDYDN